MDKEQTFLLQLIKDHIHGKKTSDSGYDIDKDKFLKIVRCHQLSSMIYLQCPALREVLVKDNAHDIFRFHNYESKNREVVNALKSRNIDCYLIKGFEVAKYYPYPYCRTMVDIDILLDNKYFDIVSQILENKGLKRISFSENELIYGDPSVTFEIHSMLIVNDYNEDIRIRDFFNNYQYYINEGKLDEEFQFLFLIAHIRKHILWKGIGFRQFIDIAMIICNPTANIDWQKVEKMANEIGIFDFMTICFALLKRWFDISCPIKEAIIDEEFYQEATNIITNNGVFGFDNSESVNERLIREYSKNSDNVFFAKIRAISKLVFPGRNLIAKDTKYRFVKNAPILLPLAWILRIINTLLDKNKRTSFKLLRDIVENKPNIVTNRTRLLKKWKV